jgi:geranylgeranyl diphosphate synthase type II
LARLSKPDDAELQSHQGAQMESSAGGQSTVPADTASFDLARYLQQRASLIEQQLAISLAESDGAPNRLLEAMRYSLMAGGKRLRPILALAACEAVVGQLEEALGYACALEMIHTYSLVHDDLPCMDDDDLRRGRPTNHKVFGEAVATLAGDALLTDAFWLIVRSAKANALAPERVLDAIADLAEAAGSIGMVGGQVLDLLAEGHSLTETELRELHGRKTGALFIASVSGGARLGGATALQLQALHDYARALGLAFQVTDDLLDIEQTTEQLGKRAQKDQQRGKATYPSLLGLERSRALANELAQQAQNALVDFDSRAMPLRMLAVFAVERNL